MAQPYRAFKVRPRSIPDEQTQEPKVSQETEAPQKIVVLNEQHHDPSKQLNLDELVVRVVVMAQLLMEKRFYPYQIALAKRIVESLLLHDGEVITSLMSRQAGKCLARGTKVLMFDGTTRCVEDIAVGDLLMGDDSSPRRVLSLARGTEQMFEVKPRCDYAESYTVNRSHILSVLFRGNRGKSDTLKDLTVDEVLQLPDSVKKDVVRGYKVSIEYPPQPVFCNPYWLGLWLGDGRSNGVQITSGDSEVITWLNEFAELLGMRLSYYAEKGECISLAIVNEKPSRSIENPLMEALRRYNLIDNKRIPHAFLANSRKIRLSLLAGLIDSDGTLTKSGFEITQKSKLLAQDIQSLARSLGFRASIHQTTKSCQTGARCTVWRVSLYGELWEVPVRVKRKKFTSKVLRENPRTYGFDLIKRPVGEYFGFEIDGNKRFVLGDYTVTHNTETIGGTTAALAMVLPMLAKQFPDDWRLNITDEQGNYRGFAEGLKSGIYAPKLEQSEITFNRVKRAVETKNGLRLMKELKLTVEENNGNTLSFSNGSRILCQSASKQSEIEGATHHLLIAEEAQDIDDLKVRKSLHPMVASTMGTIVKIGTASTRKCDFYSAIQHNRRMELLSGKRNHFFFPWSVCAKYNSLYLRYIEGEKRKIGEHSDEFRMAYCGEWIFERGMFLTQDILFNPNVAQTQGVWSNYHVRDFNTFPLLRHYSFVLGIDWGASSDSTVVCLMAVDWLNPINSGSSSDAEGTHHFAFYKKHVIGWWEFIGDNYEYQFGEIANRCLDLGSRLKKIVMDSNACGRPLYDRFAATFGPKGVEVTPFNFQPKLKSDGYKSLSADFWSERITFPAGAGVRGEPEFRKFVGQTLDLKKEWKNGVMVVAHPEERGAHDDYPDALMLAAWGCNTQAIGGSVQFLTTNPFLS